MKAVLSAGALQQSELGQGWLWLPLFPLSLQGAQSPAQSVFPFFPACIFFLNLSLLMRCPCNHCQCLNPHLTSSEEMSFVHSGGALEEPLHSWESTRAAPRPFIISLDITRESVHLKQDYFWVASCKVNLALMPLNRSSNWSDNDSSGGLSLPGHGKVCGQMSLTSCLAQRGQHGHGTEEGTRMSKSPPRGATELGQDPQAPPEQRDPPACPSCLPHVPCCRLPEKEPENKQL